MEWTLIEFGDNNNFLSTTHSNSGETYAFDEAQRLQSRGYHITEFDHSHPTPEDIYGPSGYLPNDSYTVEGLKNGIFEGDHGVADILVKNNNNFPIIFNVFDQQSRQIITYDNTHIINFNPWPY